MFSSYKIKTRLLILAGFMSIMLLTLSLIGWYGNHLASIGHVHIYEGGAESMPPLHEISRGVNNIVKSAYSTYSQNASFEQSDRILAENEASIRQNLDDYMRTISIDAGFQQSANQLNMIVQNALESFKQLHVIYANKDRDQLLSFLNHENTTLYQPTLDAIQKQIHDHAVDTHQDYAEAIANSEAFTRIMLISAALGILFSVIFAWILIKSISNALDYAISVVNKLAAGHTDVQIESTSNDEIGQLLSAMKHMIETSNSLVGTMEKVAAGDLTVAVAPRSDKDSLGIAMKGMLHNLRRMISQVQHEATIVANSSQEIVASVTQVSANTAETASAVTETTTTTEELKQTAHVASEKAQGVLENAEETLKIVKSSEQSLDSTITDMHQIQEKMRIISDSIIKLSEHNLAIGEIIDTVNDLAEQSNLLAVNAAIEAARAGEQGKSFGVVASEIRNLAEQSKNATIQVRSILNDVQNDTSAAVMATEQGSKAVAKGVNQSAQTAEAIITLSNSIINVAQAARQIAISSQQQLIGVEQVTVAMSNINEASSRHAKHMKEIETEVISLSSVGGNLRELADKYKMDHTAPVA